MDPSTRTSVPRHTGHAPWRPWAALALLAACGGTSGTEAIMGSDASSQTGGDAATGVDAAAGTDATAGADTSSGVDASIGVGDGDGLDRTVPVRPPPQDAGIPLRAVDSGAPPMDAGGTNRDAGHPTTQSILAAQSPDAAYDAADDTAVPKGCLGCANVNGCLDPAQQGGSCELVEGGKPHLSGALPDMNTCGAVLGAAASEKDICLQTLAAIFGTNCAAALNLTSCLCGPDPSQTPNCLAGTATPTGVLFDEYACDFSSTNGTTINGSFTDPTFGAGMANSIVQCLAGFIATDPNCCTCFGLNAVFDDGGMFLHCP